MTSNTTISRRRIVQGTAWTIPVVAATAAAPAMATSPSDCKPVLKFSGGAFYVWGTIDAEGGKTTQTLDMGGQTYIDNLPPGVTVRSINYQFWTQNRDGQNSAGPGAFFLANTTSDKSSSCTGPGCSLTWTPTDGSGFSPTLTNTGNLVPRVYPDGTTRKAWDLNMSWDPLLDSKLDTRYTETKSGCRNFTTGPSSRFLITYSGVTALTAAQRGTSIQRVFYYVIVTATLSTGLVLTHIEQGK